MTFWKLTLSPSSGCASGLVPPKLMTRCPTLLYHHRFQRYKVSTYQKPVTPSLHVACFIQIFWGEIFKTSLSSIKLKLLYQVLSLGNKTTLKSLNPTRMVPDRCWFFGWYLCWLKFLRWFFVTASVPWAAQVIRGVLHLHILFICRLRVIRVLFSVFWSLPSWISDVIGDKGSGNTTMVDVQTLLQVFLNMSLRSACFNVEASLWQEVLGVLSSSAGLSDHRLKEFCHITLFYYTCCQLYSFSPLWDTDTNQIGCDV